MKRTIFLLSIGLTTLLVAAPKPKPGARPDFVRQRADAALNGLVRQAERRDRNLSSVGLFAAAFNLLRANRGLDKLDVLFDVAAEMQERNPDAATLGNFRWYWRDGYVMDHNAVDFCMQEGALIARDYRGRLTPAQRSTFEKLCEYAITGSLRHQVRSSYTNIAIMNAVNLILLGEAFARTDAFDEGVKRLDAFILNTALFGVCEYSSPTYTAVDLNGLHRLHQFVRNAGVKERAERLLRLFWSDIAASSFTPAGRLSGAHSRDYDYLFGMGDVAKYLRVAGLAPALSTGPEAASLPFELSTWRPDAAIRALATTTPRVIESVWGDEPDKFRTQWTGRHVTLGVAGANYWNMDIPLAADFASTNRIPRVYFIADGRRDPYGLKKIPEGQGPHQKTLHLKPFWSGAQRGRDALGLVVYRPQDIPQETPTLESHIVFPCDVDDVLVNETPVPVTRDAAPFVRELKPGDVVFVRLGGGACGVRVPWSRNLHGDAARIALVRDGAEGVRAFRLTVAHHDAWGLASQAKDPSGAAFWIRVCDEAADAAVFAAFRRNFCASSATAEASPPLREGIRIGVAGEEGRLALEVAAPYLSTVTREPEPRHAVLAVNGRDIGTEILGTVPGVEEYRRELARMKKEMERNRLVVSKKLPVAWEAEKGVVKAKMAVGQDSQAQEGRFVWAPGERGGRGNASGSVSWQLDVKEAGTYRLWARINTPTSEDDSFYFSACKGEFAKTECRGPRVLERTEWHTPLTRGWTWAQFPVDLQLPAGPVVLTLHAREDGAKMDRVYISGDTAEPQD